MGKNSSFEFVTLRKNNNWPGIIGTLTVTTIFHRSATFTVMLLTDITFCNWLSAIAHSYNVLQSSFCVPDLSGIICIWRVIHRTLSEELIETSSWSKNELLPPKDTPYMVAINVRIAAWNSVRVGLLINSENWVSLQNFLRTLCWVNCLVHRKQ